MKKHFAAIILGLLGTAAYANAVNGTLILDTTVNYGDGSGPTATTGGLVWLDPDGNLADATLDTSVDINLEVLWGTSANNVNNVLNLDPDGLNNPASPNLLANQATGAGDISFLGEGTLGDPMYDLYFIPGENPGTTIWLQLVGWTGDSSTPYGPNVILEGQTAPFSVVLNYLSPTYPDERNMSALVLSAPEPALPTLSALGAVAFALLRRRK